MKFSNHLGVLIQKFLWLCIVLYGSAYLLSLLPKEIKIIVIFLIIVLIIITTILAIIRINRVKIYHEICKKAEAYETITRSEYELWTQYRRGLFSDNNYEGYLKKSLDLSERKLDIIIKTKVLKEAKDDWERKTLEDRLVYLFRYEYVIFPSVDFKKVFEDLISGKEYCNFCKKITTNEEQKDGVFCVICGRQRGLTE